MNTKAILAALAGAVFSFLGGWAIFGILLADFYMANTIQYEGLMKMPMPDLVYIFLSGLALSYLLSIIYSKWANVKTFGEGFKYGLVIYLLYACAVDLSLYAFYNLMNLKLTLIDIAAQTAFGGVMGGIIGVVLGTGRKSVRSRK